MDKSTLRDTVDSWGICSVAGSRQKNDDYGIYAAGIGACLADGVGGYPMGDAMARYACHTALNSMKKGHCAQTSLKHAQTLIADFTNITESPDSGASVTILKRDDDGIEVAWLGDVLCLLLRSGSTRLESLNTPHRCGQQLTRCAGGKPCNPDSASFPVFPGDRIVLCTDGVWDEMPWSDIQLALSESTSQQEACARLVLGRHVRDNATALALFVGQSPDKR